MNSNPRWRYLGVRPRCRTARPWSRCSGCRELRGHSLPDRPAQPGADTQSVLQWYLNRQCRVWRRGGGRGDDDDGDGRRPGDCHHGGCRSQNRDRVLHPQSEVALRAASLASGGHQPLLSPFTYTLWEYSVWPSPLSYFLCFLFINVILRDFQ